MSYETELQKLYFLYHFKVEQLQCAVTNVEGHGENGRMKRNAGERWGKADSCARSVACIPCQHKKLTVKAAA